MIRILPVLALLALTSCTFQPGVALKAIPQADVDACEHMNEGRALPVKGFGSDPATVDKPHARYAIELAASDGRYEGKVLYNSSVEADYVFFFDQDVALAVLDEDQHDVEIEEQASSSVACDSIKARYVVPLGVGAYTLKLGPTAAATVSLVIEETTHAGPKEEDDHDHAH